AEIEITARLEALSRDSGELARETVERLRQKENLDRQRETLRSSFEQVREEKDRLALERRTREERLAAAENAPEAAGVRLSDFAMKRAAAGNARHETDLALERVASSRARLRQTREKLQGTRQMLSEELRRAEAEAKSSAGTLERCRAALARNEELRGQ